MRIETLAVHAGYEPDPTTKAVAVPIYQTTAYAFDDTQHGADLFDLKVEGNIYTRIMNPTQAVLEQRLAAMEGGRGRAGALVGAGGPSTYAVLTIAGAGDNIVSTSTLYGGTYNLFAHTFPQLGVETPVRGAERLRRHRGADRRADQGGLLRVDRKPRGERGRRGADRRGGPCPRGCR